MAGATGGGTDIGPATAQRHEIGDAVAWLMSDKSSYVCGVALPVDGGWVAQ